MHREQAATRENQGEGKGTGTKVTHTERERERVKSARASGSLCLSLSFSLTLTHARQYAHKGAEGRKEGLARLRSRNFLRDWRCYRYRHCPSSPPRVSHFLISLAVLTSLRHGFAEGRAELDLARLLVNAGDPGVAAQSQLSVYEVERLQVKAQLRPLPVAFA